MGNKGFQAVTSWVFLLSFLAVSQVCAAQEVSITVGPYLQNAQADGITVCWMTDKKCTSWVEYGLTNELGEKATQSIDGQIDANTTFHKVTIAGLKPGQTYNYRVSSREIVRFEPYRAYYGETISSDIYKFGTLDDKKDKFSFLVFNDIHNRVDVMKGLFAAEQEPFDMVILNGDMMGTVVSEKQIANDVLQPCTELFAKEVPFHWVRGNHETRGPFSRKLKNYLGRPGGKYYYSFDHGPVHFVVMDSGEDKEDSHKEYFGLADFDAYRELEREWLAKEVKSDAFKKAPFRIVIMHMPIYGFEDWNGMLDAREKWSDLLNDKGVDLMISGHLHEYKFIEPEKDLHDYPIMINEGWESILRVDATNDELTLTVKKPGSETVDKRTLKKDSRSLLQRLFDSLK